MSAPPPAPPGTHDKAAAPELPRLIRALGVVERAGNALPHPFWLFWILSGILAVISAVLAAADLSVVSPADDKTVAVQNLLSGEGLAMAVSTMVENFATFRRWRRSSSSSWASPSPSAAASSPR